MKRLFTLIVLLGFVMGTLVTGCNKTDESTAPTTTTDTNAPSTSTNK